MKWNFAKSAQWLFFWMIVRNQWLNNVRGITSSHKSVTLVLYKCSGPCFNIFLFSDLFLPKTPFFDHDLPNMPNLANIQHFPENKKVGNGKVRAYFFHQVLNIICLSQSCVKTRLIGATSLSRTSVPTHILQQTIITIASTCDHEEMNFYIWVYARGSAILLAHVFA